MVADQRGEPRRCGYQIVTGETLTAIREASFAGPLQD